MGLIDTLQLPPLRPGAVLPPPGMPAPSGSSGDAGEASDAAPPPSAREQVQALITQLEALASSGIADDKLRASVAKDLAPLQAGFTKADAMKQPAAAQKAFTALLAPARKLLDRAERFRGVADWHEAVWKPAAAAVASTVAGIAAAAPKKAMQAELTKIDATRKTLLAKADLAGLQTLEPRVTRLGTLASRIAARSAVIDAEVVRIAGVIAGLGAEASGPITSRQAELLQRKATAWPAGATLDAVEADLDDFDAQLLALGGAVDGLKTTHDARVAFEAAYAKVRADVESAATTAADAALTGASLATTFTNARRAVDDAVAALDWAKAQAALPALVTASTQVRQNAAAKPAFEAAFGAISAAVRKARTAAHASTPLPGTLRDDFVTADIDLAGAVHERQWAFAKSLIANLDKRSKELLAMLDEGRAFYDALRPHLAQRQQATASFAGWTRLQHNARISMLGNTYHKANKAMEGFAAAQAWGDAKGAIEPMRAAAAEFAAAVAADAAQRGPFETACNAVNHRGTANRLAEAPEPPWAALAQAYLALRDAIDNAANAGDYARATPLVARLQPAIDALIAAEQAESTARAGFETAFAAVPGYADAVAMKGNAELMLATEVNAFNQAEARVFAARDKRDWAAATAALPGLTAAVAALKAEQGRFNAGVQPADEAALRAKMDALKPRIDAAGDAGAPAFVEKEQKEVRDAVAVFEKAFGARDFATAQSQVGVVERQLRGMEHWKGAYAAYRAKFDAMKNGPIAAALAKPLAPPKLDADRRAGLAATEAKIVKLADAGKLSVAEAALPKWEIEARGWAESKAAFDACASGNPDVGTLEKLAKAPGGEAVLDKIIANLDPARTPQKVLNAALKARYGFEMKHFKDKNAEERDLSGLTAHDPDRPDPDLQKLYGLMSKIPAGRIKGKIELMVTFDKDESGGVYYDDRKIYLYTDRPGKAGSDGRGDSDEERFGMDGTMMPPGQKVAPGCEPKDTIPVPEFDFVLMHEVGHAEDDGSGFMEGRTGTNGTPGDAAFGAWAHETPESIATVAAAHFDYDPEYIKATLNDKQNTPPKTAPKPRGKVDAAEWERRRTAVLTWCRMIRTKASPWNSGAVAQQIAIGKRVYHEAYNDGRWVSYALAARAQGMTSYQFRAPGEWFAELYAAHFSGKLKNEHPAMKWLAGFKPPE
jgi:hypothetical protein